MGNVVRIGDPVSCGSTVAAGSGDVFANGMPITTSATPPTTGHGCFPGSTLTGPYTSTVFVNNSPVALVGIGMAPHRCGKLVHGGSVVSGAATVSFEG